MVSTATIMSALVVTSKYCVINACVNNAMKPEAVHGRGKSFFVLFAVLREICTPEDGRLRNLKRETKRQR